jgi:hypothetical protein
LNIHVSVHVKAFAIEVYSIEVRRFFELQGLANLFLGITVCGLQNFDHPKRDYGDGDDDDDDDDDGDDGGGDDDDFQPS